MWLGISPRPPSVIRDKFSMELIRDKFSMELDQSVQSPVRCPRYPLFGCF